MFVNDLSPFLIGFCAIVLLLCALCVRFVIILGNQCRDAIDFVNTQNEKSLSLAKLAQVDATLTDLTDSYEALLDSHKKLRSRIAMRNLREKRKNGLDSEEEDLQSTTDKEKLRFEARQKKLL